MEFAELKNKPNKELAELLAEERATVHALRIKAKSGQLKQVHEIKKHKRIIARILTVLRADKASVTK